MSDLSDLLEAQAKLQLKMPGGKDPRDMEEEEKALFIKDMVLALSDELHELLDEVGWKPWATSRHVNFDSAQSELIDALHFFLNLALALNLNGRQMKELYYGKNKKNHQRQEEGYDGISSKCGYCRRALDDEDELLARGEAGCWISSDGNTGYCREAGLQIVNDFICPICTSTFRFTDSKVHNEYVTVDCEPYNGHRFIVPTRIQESWDAR